MDFLKELFGDKALTFEELKAAVEAASDKIKVANLKDGGYVDKDKFTAKETELTLIKEQIAAANKQIDDFKKLDVEAIKATADKYKADYEAAEAKRIQDLEALQFSFALEKGLTSAKAKNVKAVKALLDLDKLKIKDGEIEGLKEQLDAVVTDAPYLFDIEPDEDDEEEDPVKLKFNKPCGSGGQKKTTKDMTYSEMMEYLKKNPNAKI